MKNINILLIFFLPICVYAAQKTTEVVDLKLDTAIIYTTPKGQFSPDFRIYCYNGVNKNIIYLFQSLYLEMDIDNDDFVLYEGNSEETVRNHYDKQRSLFSMDLFNTNKRKLIKLNPFNQTCVGINTQHPYKIRLNLIRIDFWKVTFLLIGFVAFFAAKSLSETPLFYYLTGILLGIFASFLILVYFVSKLFPKKPMMYGVMVGGWTLGLYFAQMLWENVQMIIMTHQSYIFWYVILTGFLSFIICYRFGPPTNPRSKNIIKWGLQMAAVTMVYLSSHYKEAVIGINIIITIMYYFPKSILYKAKGLWLRKFPPKRRFLTNEEYFEQTARETTKALNDLKNFCSSPESQPWKVMLKLKNPQRFASFVEGSSHILDNEILEYESFREDNADISDDSDDDIGNNTTIPQTSIRSNGRYSKVSQLNGHRSRHPHPQTSTPLNIERNLNQIEFSEDED